MSAEQDAVAMVGAFIAGERTEALTIARESENPEHLAMYVAGIASRLARFDARHLGMTVEDYWQQMVAGVLA